MRILIDTNILFSALLFPDSVPANALKLTLTNHDMVLCEQNILELKTILKRKTPQYLDIAEKMLSELEFELLPDSTAKREYIRDAKDQPILNAAIEGHIDYIVTGDKDFLCLDITKPKCVTAAEFLSLMKM